METRAFVVERVLLLVVAAVALGVHAGLAPDHLREWAPLGGSFVAAAASLSVLVAALALRPGARRPAAALALVLAGLIAGYLATRLAALPPLDPTREPFDPLGAATTALEAAGVVVAVRLARRHLRSPTQGGRR